jgi:hypothetical protein
MPALGAQAQSGYLDTLLGIAPGASDQVRPFFREAPTELTPDVFRSCCGGQVG